MSDSVRIVNATGRVVNHVENSEVRDDVRGSRTVRNTAVTVTRYRAGVTVSGTVVCSYNNNSVTPEESSSVMPHATLHQERVITPSFSVAITLSPSSGVVSTWSFCCRHFRSEEVLKSC